MRVFLAFLLAASAAHAQFEIEESHTKADLRGIHALGGGVAWASGTDGTVLRTEDGGYLWQTCTVPPGAEKLDFRGIQGFDANTAIVMSSGKGDLSRLYKTTDGCQSWKLVFTNPDRDGFWDAIKFTSRAQGYILGDPVMARFVLLATSNGGQSWSAAMQDDLTAPGGNIGAFAASNSSMTVSAFGPSFATGYSYLYRGQRGCTAVRERSEPNECLQLLQFDRVHLPMAAERDTAGVFSLGRFGDTVVAVGGDYGLPESMRLNAAYSYDDGRTWLPAELPPHGYRSSVAYDAPTKTWITVGPNGTDISRDDGKNWQPLHPGPQDAPDADKSWNALSLPFVVGPNGRIGKLRPSALTPK